jgi:hypothetical protein
MDDEKDNFDKEIPEDIKELLNKHYRPKDQGSPNFENFFSELESKIDKKKELDEIASQTKDIYESYEKRQVKLKSLLKNLLCEKERTPKTFTFSKRKKILLSVFILCFLTLASIATIRGIDSYNYIDIGQENIDWGSLKLSEEQKTQIKEIESKWIKLESSEKNTISFYREKLQEEIKKERPNFVLIDKYQRDILDKEISLKREKTRYFLEMRFLLNEEQTLKLLRQSN